MPLEYSDKALMECRLCSRKFSDDDRRALDYFSDVGICFDCLEKGKKKPASVWCFGKKECYNPYDPKNRSCTEWCPDRRVCPLFADGSIYRLHQIARVL